MYVCIFKYIYIFFLLSDSIILKSKNNSTRECTPPGVPHKNVQSFHSIFIVLIKKCIQIQIHNINFSKDLFENSHLGNPSSNPSLLVRHMTNTDDT